MLSEGHLVCAVDHPEWGVGSIEEIVSDRADVRFYRRGEQVRSCALYELRRHRYRENDQIFALPENAFGIVVGWRETNGLITYEALFGQRRKRIPENSIAPIDVTASPFDTARDEEPGDARTFVLALQARRLSYAYRYDELVCLSNARIELMPHQVFVADRVLGDYPHRFLLSDEVGLGKTIEAGLILKELRARGAARRVLVIVPSGLVSQWVDELNKKFNEPFTRIDSTNMAARIADCGGIAERVWESYPSIVTSLHLLRSNEGYSEAVAAQHWDLVIFDEAHNLRRYLQRQRTASADDQDDRRTTVAYKLAQRLQQRTTSLLLLTATPLQLDTYELFSLVELLDPALFANFGDFERYRTQVPRLNTIARSLDQFERLGDRERTKLASDLGELLRAHDVAGQHRALDIHTLLNDPAQRQAFQTQVGGLHRLTRVLIRNRKRQVFDDMQPRVARMLHVQFSSQEQEAYDAVSDYLRQEYNLALMNHNQALGFLMVMYRKILTSSSYALRQSFQRRIERLQKVIKAGNLLTLRAKEGELSIDEDEELEKLLERYGNIVGSADPELLNIEIARLKDLCAMLERIPIDTKAQRLLQELSTLLAEPKAKVLIFTQFKETLVYLQQLLEPRYAVTVFFGDMDAVEKDQAVDDFREGKQILIATEAAGEGRNLQFCHVMFNYDLPWNPMKIEQRIGRLDRIGQSDPVLIHNFAIAGTLEDRVLEVLHRRINIFESIIGTLDPILESVEQDVRELVFSGESDREQQFVAFERRVSERMREIERMDETLNDFILDTHSFRRDRADALLGRKPAFTSADIRHFVGQFLEHTGGHIRDRDAEIYELAIPRRIQAGTKLDLRDSYRATFDAALAQQQERLDFVAFGHPVLDRAVEVCLDEQFGGVTAHLTIETEEHPAQQAVVAIYDFQFDGLRPRRQVRAFAAALDGSFLPALSEQFPALALHAKAARWSASEREVFDASLEQCRDAIETEVATAREAERQQQDVRNRQEYDQAHRKLTRYYDAQQVSLEREIAQLERTLSDQQQIDDPKARRILPATQGRINAARRQLDDLVLEREQRLGALSKQRAVVASEELLSVVYVNVQAPSEKDR